MKIDVYTCDWCNMEVRDPKLPRGATYPHLWGSVTLHCEPLHKRLHEAMVCPNCIDAIYLLQKQIKAQEGAKP